MNTGCLLYPSSKTCISNLTWSVPKEEVKALKTHYEWWAKAGGGPNYKHKLNKDDYIKNFNWLPNWIDRHFFNKVSDTLLAILFISLILLLYFKSHKKIKNKNKFKKTVYILSLFFLLEWFLNHPAMRYGGFVLFAIPIFLFFSEQISKYKISKKKLIKGTYYFVIITLIIFNVRNIHRINKEYHVYNYDLLKSPFYYVPNIETKIVATFNDFNIYSPKEGEMCWASKTPCSYAPNLNIKKYFNTYIIKRTK